MQFRSTGDIVAVIGCERPVARPTWTERSKRLKWATISISDPWKRLLPVTEDVNVANGDTTHVSTTKAIEMPKLDGKVIIVTGSTQGVGEAVAMHAASDGAQGVVICGRQEKLGTAVSAALTERGTQALYVQADLSVVADCQRIVERCDETFGRVDGLVNAAADTNRGTLEETTAEFWDYQFAVNVRAPFLLTQASVNIMKREQIAGSIVNILSVAAYCGMNNLVSYSSSKGALSTFTKNTANGLRRHRIRVNGINLGWTDTPNEHVVQSLQGSPTDWLEKAEHLSPFGRLLKPDDVARLCTYLLSDESGILTGSNIDFTQRVMGMFPPETGIKA